MHLFLLSSPCLRVSSSEGMIESDQVSRVVRAVANGDGDWSEIPRCVREAILLALTGSRSLVAQRSNAGESLVPSERRQPSPWQTSCNENEMTPSLTEEMVQRSVRTFEDAVWLRDQAVRTFAWFHNNIEGMREAMRHQLRSLWCTAIQLDPDILQGIQQELKVMPHEEIPENTTISGDVVRRLAHLEGMVAEIEYSLEALRAVSVRFAANMLSDDEKRAMGLDPADLRPEDVEEYTTLHRGSSSPPPSYMPAAQRGCSVQSALFDSPRMKRGELAAEDLYEGGSVAPETSSTRSGSSNPVDDTMLKEMRKRYINRMALLKEAKLLSEGRNS